MYQIAIILNNTDANLSLSYKTKEGAVDARNRLATAKSAGNDVTENDDYGYIFDVNGKDISYLLFIDLDEAQTCQHEKNLAIARAGKRLAERVNIAPEERALLNIGQSPNQSRILDS